MSCFGDIGVPGFETVVGAYTKHDKVQSRPANPRSFPEPPKCSLIPNPGPKSPCRPRRSGKKLLSFGVGVEALQPKRLNPKPLLCLGARSAS